jgi:hypothetical protein
MGGGLSPPSYFLDYPCTELIFPHPKGDVQLCDTYLSIQISDSLALKTKDELLATDRQHLQNNRGWRNKRRANNPVPHFRIRVTARCSLDSREVCFGTTGVPAEQQRFHFHWRRGWGNKAFCKELAEQQKAGSRNDGTTMICLNKRGCFLEQHKFHMLKKP